MSLLYRIATQTLAFLLLILATNVSIAGIIYDNGPINGEENGLGTSKYEGIYEIANSFFVPSPSSLTSVSYAIWVNPITGRPPTVYYTIGTSSFGSDIAVDYSEAANTWDFLFTNQAGFSIYSASFQLDTNVQSGTYWITLGSLGGGYFVDSNGGPSTAFLGNSSESQNGLPPTPDNTYSIPSSSFQIHGEQQAAVPEPSSMLLFCSGFGCLLIRHAKKRRRTRRRVPRAMTQQTSSIGGVALNAVNRFLIMRREVVELV